MKVYCEKCGNEIDRNSKFCGKCGAKVNGSTLESMKNSNSIMVNAPAKKKGRKYIKPGIAIVALILVIVVGKLILSGTASSSVESPLKNQVTGINKQNQKVYAKSFTDKGKEYFLDSFSEEDFKESAEEYKKVTYEVNKVEEGDFYDVWDALIIRYYDMSDHEKEAWYGAIDEVKIVEATITYEYKDGGSDTRNEEFRMIKVNKKWYTIDSLL